jgi:hypothetical protein
MRITPDSIRLTKAEAAFRAMAFRIFYNQVFAGITDLTARFARAIAYSAGEMSDRSLFQTWWEWTEGKSMKGLLASGKQPPPQLRPFVEAYVSAIGERAKQTGDEITDLI